MQPGARCEHCAGKKLPATAGAPTKARLPSPLHRAWRTSHGAMEPWATAGGSLHRFVLCFLRGGPGYERDASLRP